MPENFPHSHYAGAGALGAPSRRDFLYGLGTSIGGAAFTSLLAAEEERSAPLAPKPAQLPARAKRCIFLMMEGGPSHIDTFDPKPSLAKLHLKEFNRSGEQKSAIESGKRYFVQSPFEFHQRGESGAWMSEPWQHLAGVADELCFYRGCQVDSVNHVTAMFQMNCGNRFGGDPAIGSWVTYLRPQVPAGAQAGREGGAFRPALRRQLGQPRLHRARAWQPHPPGRPADRCPDP
jgi:hypothetical protein